MKTYKLKQKTETYGTMMYHRWRIGEYINGQLKQWRGGNFDTATQARQWAIENSIKLDN